MWASDGLTCAITAPTGLAAFNVGGNTIHRVFQLPIEHEGKSATYWSLPKASQKVMRTTLRNVKFIIVDEVSMVSRLNLAYKIPLFMRNSLLMNDRKKISHLQQCWIV